jgi:hypothetical protein
MNTGHGPGRTKTTGGSSFNRNIYMINEKDNRMIYLGLILKQES